MSNKKDGGPAFPTTKPLEGWGDPNQGMTLRDYFAAAALTGVFANNSALSAFREGPRGPSAEIARAVWRMAETMIEERDK
jgi:hypothetical protein